ncbi:prostaglandin E2 receptor EP4 subtype-like isoform X2 [Biomphalaria glabrata]|uniref:Prostaglandin E2 receptor EP4 subtype-like isoform X2 n=1 Tax=Biomphalaria glabrata TaxID=6526 RepID=A0A9W3AIB5_BIOGL|nr:prostaglandin E2 receptor EP4 subtype-like isoform X2 [Biomphalaria glabrata]
MSSLLSNHLNNSTATYHITTSSNLSWNSSQDGFLPPQAHYGKTVAVPAIMFCVGVVGNLAALLILTFKPSKDSRSTAFYHLVKALAIMDLFGIVASSPVTMVVYAQGGVLKTGGMPLCDYFSFILVMAGNATVFIVLVMGIERFLVTEFPFQYSKLVTPFTVNMSIAVVWLSSVLIAILPIVGMGRNVERYPNTWCFFDDRGTDVGGQLLSYFYAIIGLLSIAITIVLNLIVIQHLWRMRRSRLSTSIKLKDSSPEATRKRFHYRLDSETRMVIFLMAIIVVFTVCYAPWMFRILVNQKYNTGPSKVPETEDYIDMWALRLASLNQILDPWVYIISRVTCCSSRKLSDRSYTSEIKKKTNASPVQQLLIRNEHVDNDTLSLTQQPPDQPKATNLDRLV